MGPTTGSGKERSRNVKYVEAYVGKADGTWYTRPVDVPDSVLEGKVEEYTRKAIIDNEEDVSFCGVLSIQEEPDDAEYRQYRVGWGMPVEARDPIHAAKIAREVQLDTASTLTIYSVYELSTGKSTVVDASDGTVIRETESDG
jgi:hypothetical protein